MKEGNREVRSAHRRTMTIGDTTKEHEKSRRVEKDVDTLDKKRDLFKGD